jgi:hypothetical protein
MRLGDLKKKEIEYELRGESPNNYAVCINDKPWKVVSSRSRAEKMANTLKAKGKNAAVHMTGAPVSEAEQVKASDKKPKKIKPNKGNESPHPMRGKLVGETSINTGTHPHKGKYQFKLQKDADSDAHDVVVLQKHQINSYTQLLQDKYPDAKVWAELIEANNKKPELPKQNNPVAKHSRNMPGAGAHKSSKDYDRKKQKQDLKKQLDEAPYVVSKTDAVKTAVERTKDWLHSLWTKSGDAQLEGIKELGVLAGFTVDKRSENNIIFNKFFTQTEDNKR